MVKWNLYRQKTKNSVKIKVIQWFFFTFCSTIKVIQSPDGAVYYMIYWVQKFNEMKNRSPFSLV